MITDRCETNRNKTILPIALTLLSGLATVQVAFAQAPHEADTALVDVVPLPAAQDRLRRASHRLPSERSCPSCSKPQPIARPCGS